MANIWLPAETDLARAMRGALSPRGVPPRGPLRINWSNQLAKKLKAYLIVQNGRVIDLVSGQIATPVGSGATFEFLDGVECLNPNGSGYFEIANAGNSTRLHDRTLFASTATTSSSSSYQNSFCALENNFRIGHKFAAEALLDTGWTSTKLFTYAFQANQRTNYAVNSKSTSIADAFINGAGFFNVGGTFRAYSLSGNGTLQFGGEAIFGAAESRIFSVALFEPVLTSEEAASLTLDSYQIVESSNDVPVLIGVPAGGGAPTLSSPGVINVQSDRATPQVTLTF